MGGGIMGKGKRKGKEGKEMGGIMGKGKGKGKRGHK